MKLPYGPLWYRTLDPHYIDTPYFILYSSTIMLHSGGQMSPLGAQKAPKTHSLLIGGTINDKNQNFKIGTIGQCSVAKNIPKALKNI